MPAADPSSAACIDCIAQAYGRYNDGINHYVKMLTCANQLCRQTVAYVCLDDDGEPMPKTLPGEFPKPGQSTVRRVVQLPMQQLMALSKAFWVHLLLHLELQYIV